MPVTPQIIPVISVQDRVEVYRVEGHPEAVTFKDLNGALVSFAPGQYSARLEIYQSQPGPTTPPLKTVNHIIGSDPTLALMILTPADLAALTRDDGYVRKVIITSPQGQSYVVIDGILDPRT